MNIESFEKSFVPDNEKQEDEGEIIEAVETDILEGEKQLEILPEEDLRCLEHAEKGIKKLEVLPSGKYDVKEHIRKMLEGM